MPERNPRISAVFRQVDGPSGTHPRLGTPPGAERKAKELNDALLRVAPGAKNLYVVEEVSGTTVSRAGPDPKPQPGVEVDQFS